MTTEEFSDAEGHTIRLKDVYAATGKDYEPFLTFDIIPNKGSAPRTYLNLPNAEARKLAEWILEHVPEDYVEPLTLRDWAEIPIGAEFGFGVEDTTDRFTFYPYEKTGEWTYGAGSYSTDIRNGAVSDLSRGLHWRPVPPKTTAEQILDLEVGTKFRIAGKDTAHLTFVCTPDDSYAVYDSDNNRLYYYAVADSSWDQFTSKVEVID